MTRILTTKTITKQNYMNLIDPPGEKPVFFTYEETLLAIYSEKVKTILEREKVTNIEFEEYKIKHKN